LARCPSSRIDGVVYDVRLEDGAYVCPCPGFAFRQTCRHVTAVAALRALPLATPGEPRCPNCAEDRLIEWDASIRKFACAVCGGQWT
jgi:hypothetical protein